MTFAICNWQNEILVTCSLLSSFQIYFLPPWKFLINSVLPVTIFISRNSHNTKLKRVQKQASTYLGCWGAVDFWEDKEEKLNCSALYSSHEFWSNFQSNLKTALEAGGVAEVQSTCPLAEHPGGLISSTQGQVIMVCNSVPDIQCLSGTSHISVHQQAGKAPHTLDR